MALRDTRHWQFGLGEDPKGTVDGLVANQDASLGIARRVRGLLIPADRGPPGKSLQSTRSTILASPNWLRGATYIPCDTPIRPLGVTRR